VDYSLEAQPYDDLPPFNPSFYGNGSTRTDLLLVDDSVLPPQPSVSGEILAEFIGNSKEVDSTDALEDDEEVLGMSGSLSAWFDCIVKEDALQVSSPTPTNKKGASTTHSKMSSEDNSQYADSAPTKSRKARKSAAKENNNHGEHDSEMDDVAPALIDEKRKRRYWNPQLHPLHFKSNIPLIFFAYAFKSHLSVKRHSGQGWYAPL
jgi:hypothetical protein